jgi:hypothetical protein
VFFAAAIFLLCGRDGWADDGALTCGVPVTASLASGAHDEYELEGFGEGVVVVSVADVSRTTDLLNLSSDDHRTCYGALSLAPHERSVEVSDCVGHDSGTYALTANVVSDTADNCSSPMPCGEFPNARRLLVPGQVDAYSFTASGGDAIHFKAMDVRGALGRMRVRLFDPDGQPVNDEPSCSGKLDLTVAKTGKYTVLINGCGEPAAALYLLSFTAPSCPRGPDVTYLGVARADGNPQVADDYDEGGRAIYRRDFGAAFMLIIEARPGLSGSPVGDSAYDYSPADADLTPDLQVLVDRPLGDGNPQVCEPGPHYGGVPATPLLEYEPLSAVSAAINDFGCRIDNGAGFPSARGAPDACTSFSTGDFGFVERSSTLQFCMAVSQAWSLPEGATHIKARVRDIDGNVGAAREMIVQVGDSKPTPTVTPTACVGDCNGDAEVTIDELLTGVGIILAPPSVLTCASMDANQDGEVTIDEIIQAVGNALGGCAS